MSLFGEKTDNAVFKNVQKSHCSLCYHVFIVFTDINWNEITTN